MKVRPLFKSHFSVGRSILTLSEATDKTIDELYPYSIFDIAKQNNLKQVIIVDSSISGFLEAYTNAKKSNVELIYGLLLYCIDSIDKKNEECLKTMHKVVVFIKNSNGYKDLIKISNCSTQNGFYYHPNIDFKHLKELWTDNLVLSVPFYDSFIHKNVLEGFRCVPDFSFTKPTFFVENSDLPFDDILQKRVTNYAEKILAQIVKTRSIYYYKYEDFYQYCVFRCLAERSNLEQPEIDHLSSNKFCFEEWQKQSEV